MQVIEVPEEIYDVLLTIAKRRGKSIEEVILEALVKDLDPNMRIEIYLKLYMKYFDDAEKLYTKGDLVQAGEKYWGAVAALINAIGERRNWNHYSHRDYSEIIERLSEELKEPLGRFFASVERLHANYYHGFLSRMNFEAHKEDAVKLIQKLKGLVEAS